MPPAPPDPRHTCDGRQSRATQHHAPGDGRCPGVSDANCFDNQEHDVCINGYECDMDVPTGNGMPERSR
ncbi:hypothetical protein E2C01_062228 [Portunus trituberculatus]|uniref:Uncharacterized protein n=1 Tax=Portunus trituberculatus TaxID=210409 RepID=A0A5B7HGI2_PORTR|nr:hypothetical protein [Portunus trituberculatus]